MAGPELKNIQAAPSVMKSCGRKCDWLDVLRSGSRPENINSIFHIPALQTDLIRIRRR